MSKKQTSLRHRLHRLVPITLLEFLLRIVAKLPLPILRGIAFTLIPKGLCAIVAKKIHFPLNDTLHQYFPERVHEIKTASIQNLWLNTFEFPWLWRHQHLTVDFFEVKRGQEFIDRYLGKSPVLFVNGHFGQWEAIPVYLALRGFKGCNTYSVGRHDWIERLLQWRHQRPPFVCLPNDFKGVRQLLKQLQTNAFSTVMFDQVPQSGLGHWSTFFEQPTYTMTLASKLSAKPGVRTAFMFCLRTSSGFALYIDDITELLSGNIQERTQIINAKLESEIRQRPEYYIWTYPRFRQPRD